VNLWIVGGITKVAKGAVKVPEDVPVVPKWKLKVAEDDLVEHAMISSGWEGMELFGRLERYVWG